MKCLVVVLMLTFIHSLLGVNIQSSKKFPMFTFPNEVSQESGPLRIVNGQQASPNQFPYQVGLYIQQKLTQVFCGGSLISTRYVLTAAHCTEGALSIDVILGAYNISDSNEGTRQRQTSVDYINHPYWDRGSLTNDIAIIKLNMSVQVNDYVQTIELVSGDETFVGYEGTVTGWGITSDSQKAITDILRYESNPILSNDACKSVDVNYDGVIQDTHLCLSGEDNKSICEGDSGGPLTAGNVQVGITSFNYQSCEAGKPSVFTRISEFTQWIQDNSDVVIVKYSFECEVTSRIMSFKSVIFICASLWICIFGQEAYLEEFTTTLASLNEIPVKQPSSPFVFNKDKSPSIIVKRIIGGDVATPHAYPFEVALYVYVYSALYFCGGSLITNEFIMTAAHCVDGATNFIAVLGAHDLNVQEDNRLAFNTSTFIIHEGWNSNTLQNDIALVKLPEKVTFSSYISPVTMASGTDTYSGLISRVLGWGKTTYGSLSDVLRYVDAPVITNEQCSSYSEYTSYIVNHHLCTEGNGTVGSCNGDSGGALLVNGVQVGIVSFGVEDCTASLPSVYTRVTDFNDWVYAQVAAHTTNKEDDVPVNDNSSIDKDISENGNSNDIDARSDAFKPVSSFGLFLSILLLLL
ncbi:uncharacterized protein [Euwallacea fornicatus]|uniref:uncharacterized protein n=1 Tax=Euwallacea fornicatus TaxID=995702 RepID=UPI00338E2C10